MQEDFDLLEAVARINTNIVEIATDLYEDYPLIFKSNGAVHRVIFLGNEIFNTEDDIRDYDEYTDQYEPYEDYLIRTIHHELDRIRYIKLNLEGDNHGKNHKC